MLGDEPVDGAYETAAAESTAAGNGVVSAGVGNDSGVPDGSGVVDGEPGESETPAAGDDITPAAGADLETVVRDVLRRTYARYWRTDDSEIIARVVEILNNPALVKHPRFEAADRIRAVLWQGTNLAGPSAAATCNVFFAVGREGELGQVARDASLYTEGIIY